MTGTLCARAEEIEKWYQSLSPRQREDFDRDLARYEAMLEREIEKGNIRKNDDNPPLYFLTEKGRRLAEAERARRAEDN